MNGTARKEFIRQQIEASQQRQAEMMEMITGMTKNPPKPFPAWVVIMIAVMLSLSAIVTAAICGSSGY